MLSADHHLWRGRMSPDSEPSADVLDRARGCVLGQAIGDTLGTTVEFRDEGSIKQEFPDGEDIPG